MKFYKIPFVWLIFPFILGIASPFFSPVTNTNFFILQVIFLILLFFSVKIQFKYATYFRPVFIFACLYYLGNLLIQFENANQLDLDTYNAKEQKYWGVIDEVSTTKSGYYKYIIQCSSFKTSAKKTKKLVFTKINNSKQPYQENTKVIFNCKFKQIKNIGYPGEFDSEFYWKNKGVYFIGFVTERNMKHLKNTTNSFITPTSCRNYLSNILKSELKGQELALANALLLGERSLLTAQTSNDFGNTGAMHILAVSGLHIGILLQILLLFFSLFQKIISKNKAIIISLIFAWLYALITGFTPSVIRSVVMFTFIFLGQIRGKENSEINILALSAFLILCWKPLYIFDIGFQLSYTAMLGIYTFYPYLKNCVYSRFNILQKIIEGTMIGIAAQITTIPLSLYYFHQFPNYFILTNIALMAFSFVILILGMLLFTFSWFVSLKIFFGILLQKTMSIMLQIVGFMSKLPFATASGFSLNKLTVLLVYICIFLLLYSLYSKKTILLHLTLVVSIFLTSFIFWNRIQKNTQTLYYQHSDSPVFKILKSKKTNYFLFPKTSWNSNKTKRIIHDFSTVYPGKNVLLPAEKIINIK